MAGAAFDRITANGYGRHLIKGHLTCPVISEISAFVLGARFFSTDCDAILDIGGQDTKAISLDDHGNLCKFEMNDRCAAGTAFIEVMATVLGFTLEEFSAAALSAKRAEKINSMCTVFAESEIVSLISQRADRNDVALGIHKAIVSRSAGLLKRVAPTGKIFFARWCCVERLREMSSRKRDGYPGFCTARSANGRCDWRRVERIRRQTVVEQMRNK